MVEISAILRRIPVPKSTLRHGLAALTIIGLLMPATAHLQQSDPTVAPYVTRAEAVAVVLLSRSIDKPNIPADNGYRDIPEGSWYQDYMLAAAHLGIIQAGDTQELRPNELLNRAELLKMIALSFGIGGKTSTYQDVPSDVWYASFAGIAQQYHVFPEDPDMLELHPTKLVTFHETVLAVQAVLQARLDSAPKADLITRVERLGNKSLFVVSSGDKTVFVGEPEDQAKLLSPDKANPSREQVRTEILDEVNHVRTRYGLRPLRYHQLMEDSAQRYAQDMSERNFFSHVSPSGQTLKDRMIATGYYNRTFSLSCMCIKGFAIAENLARGQQGPGEAFDAWMHSPNHRAAILNADYTDTGLGVLPEEHIWVEHFGGVLLPGQEEMFTP